MQASNSRWGSPAPGVVLISTTPDWRVRLFGVPFFVVAVYLGYQIVATIGDAISARDASVITIPGLLFMLVLFGAFAIPAILLLAGRAEAIVDGAAREALVRLRYGLYTREQRYPLADFAVVEVAHETDAVGSSNLRRPIHLSQFVVRLRARDDAAAERFVRLGYFNDDRADDARQLATALAPLAGLDLKDHSAGTVARQAKVAAGRRLAVTGWRRVIQVIAEALFTSRD